MLLVAVLTLWRLIKACLLRNQQRLRSFVRKSSEHWYDLKNSRKKELQRILLPTITKHSIRTANTGNDYEDNMLLYCRVLSQRIRQNKKALSFSVAHGITGSLRCSFKECFNYRPGLYNIRLFLDLSRDTSYFMTTSFRLLDSSDETAL